MCPVQETPIKPDAPVAPPSVTVVPAGALPPELNSRVLPETVAEFSLKLLDAYKAGFDRGHEVTVKMYEKQRELSKPDKSTKGFWD